MRFVETLAGFQRLFRSQAKPLAGIDLEVRKGIWKGRRLGFLVARARRHLARSARDPRPDGGRVLAVDWTPGIVHDAWRALGGLPGGDEVRVAGPNGGADDVVRPRLEVFDLAVTANDEAEQWRLHPPYRENAIVPTRAPQDRVEASQVNAIEPVRALARQGRFGEASELRVRPELAERLLNRGRREIGDQEPIDWALVAEELQHLVDEELSFAIGIAGVHDPARLRQERADGLQQLPRRNGETPLTRRDGKVLETPRFVLRRVGLWLG